MSRRYIRNSGLMLVLGLFKFGCGEPEPEEHPNILWITSEDNSPFMGAYGDDYADTPNLDRLADAGIVYENAYATTPVCAPSRFTLITGTTTTEWGRKICEVSILFRKIFGFTRLT